MGFMQKQVTDKEAWLRVETDNGTEFIPGDLLGNIPDMAGDDDSDQFHTLVNQIQMYTEGEPQSWETVQGFGARLSAPGYMDCTDWAVFSTAEKAEQYLAENFEDEETE
jgi:hypothetical protein